MLTLEARHQQDTHQNQQAEQQLQEKLLFYEQLAIMGKIILCAAHELNSSLEGIRRYLVLAQEKENDDGKVKRCLTTALNGLHQMSLTVGSLLSYAHPPKAPRTADNLLNQLQQAVGLTLFQASEQQVQVSFHLPNELSQVTIAGELSQVFLRIIKTALQAIPQGGTLKIFGNVEPQGIEINFLHTNPGFPPHEGIQSGQAYSSPEDNSQELGLGEPMVGEILQRNGGQLSIETQPGLGTKVKVLLSRPESSTSLG